MELLCSICGKRVGRDWYCYTCYKKYQDDIKSNKPWTKFLQSEEKKRRRRIQLIYLGNSNTGDGQIWQVGNPKTID